MIIMSNTITNAELAELRAKAKRLDDIEKTGQKKEPEKQPENKLETLEVTDKEPSNERFFCSKCNNEIKKFRQKFCESCGEELAW